MIADTAPTRDDVSGTCLAMNVTKIPHAYIYIDTSKNIVPLLLGIMIIYDFEFLVVYQSFMIIKFH